MTEAHEEAHEHVGFFERRWRMAKAGIKKAFSYLFDIKTYIYAGVLFGGAALLGTTGTGFGTDIANFFGVADGAAGVLAGMGRAVVLGTLINATVAMVKESNACNDCENGVHPSPHAVQPERSVVGGVAHELTHGATDLLHEVRPPSVPYAPPRHGQKPSCPDFR